MYPGELFTNLMVLLTVKISAIVADEILELISLTVKLISGLVIPLSQFNCPKAPLRMFFSMSTRFLFTLLVFIVVREISSRFST